MNAKEVRFQNGHLPLEGLPRVLYTAHRVDTGTESHTNSDRSPDVEEKAMLDRSTVLSPNKEVNTRHR